MIASQEAWNTPKQIDVFEPDHLDKFTYLSVYALAVAVLVASWKTTYTFCNPTYFRRKQEKMTFIISS